ncbi:MAG: DUF502 domain-containing protein [Thermoanaerobaculia bacterium]
MTAPPHPPRAVPRRTLLKRFFLTGLVILVPVTLTLFILRAIFNYMDGIFAPVVNRFVQLWFPIDHVPGLGLVMTLLVVLLLGWLSTRVAGRRLIRAMEAALGRVPIAGSVYGAAKGVLEAISAEKGEAFKRVVLVEYPKSNVFAIAFVTGSARWPRVDERLEDALLVFLPTTPNPTSGFLLLVPRSEAIPLPIPVEEGIRMVISGGVLTPPLVDELIAVASTTEAETRSGSASPGASPRV